MYTIIGNLPSLTFTCMGYLYQQVCSIFKYKSFNTTHQAFYSIINEKKDVFVNLTTYWRRKSLIYHAVTEAIRCNIRI
jgi:hypothetical protein